MKKVTCGMKNNYDELNIYTENQRKRFGYNGIRYKNEKYKIAEYGVCSYKIQNAPDAFVGGHIFLRFNYIEKGLRIWVTTSGEKQEFMISNVKKETPEERLNSTREIYEIQHYSNFQLTAVPLINNFNTSFEIEYWNNGIKNPDAKYWIKKAEH